MYFRPPRATIDHVRFVPRHVDKEREHDGFSCARARKRMVRSGTLVADLPGPVVLGGDRRHGASRGAERKPMTTPIAVQARGLTKHFGTTTAVERLDLTIPRGMIYGFLGPNGAGKTTTLRMLLGLVRPSQGHIRVLDSSPGTADGLARIRALIEGPAFYPFLSGYANLRLCARYAH